ncbi:MAG: four helix bundle protein [Candidatus Komeilibacteria bacterium]|nr:four helix bundle protein [Candidatus Komeilibacteria bacterium]
MSITKIRSFRDLFAWQEAHKLVLDIYTKTRNFPKEEMYGLVNQMRRCVVSVSSNIAEGFSRQSYLEKAHFYSMSQGSVTELQNQLIIANDVHYISDELFQVTYEQSVKVHKLLNGLIKKSKAIHNS